METVGQPNTEMSEAELIQKIGDLVEQSMSPEEYQSLVRCVQAGGEYEAKVIDNPDGSHSLNIQWDETAGLPDEELQDSVD